MNRLETASLESLLSVLYQRINYEGPNRPRPGDFKLANMYRLLEALGNPHLACPVVHVAGTKGKGSVSTMIRSILTECGKRIGIYNSPHLERINQRISIGPDNISDELLRQTLLEIWPTVQLFDEQADQAGERKLTFFEIITATGFLFFANQKLDAVVLEVGMGGRLDSTNVCESILAVITSISLDHTKQLGSTLDLIAREKAGIIKTGIPVVSGVTESEPAAAIAEVAGQNKSRLFVRGQDFSLTSTQDIFGVSFSESSLGVSINDLKSSLAGAHQMDNAAIAVAACRVLNMLREDSNCKSLEWKISDEAIRRGLANVSLPGRAELICESPAVLVDIAHNAASLTALARTLNDNVPKYKSAAKRRLIFAASRDKDIASMLAPLVPLFDEVWLTRFANNPRATPPKKLLKITKSSLTDGSNISAQFFVANNPNETWERIEASLQPEDFICVTGSAFLIAEFRPLLQNWAATKKPEAS